MKFSTNGEKFFPVTNANSVIDYLPAAIYEVSFSPDLGFHLIRQATSFNLPSKRYNTGSVDSFKMSELFIKRYTDSQKNLGVLLSGVKGTGKSMLLKLAANKALETGLPVIVVSESFTSAHLAKFLSSLTLDCVVLFDEFEKLFTRENDSDSSQEDLLSFFDGTAQSHKLIILTVNELHKVNEFFINRPSRIRYLLEYKPLSEEFVTMYLEETLLDPSVASQVADELITVSEMNFDLLQTVVEEVNVMYPSLPIPEIVKMLNVTDLTEDYQSYTVRSYINGEFIAEDNLFHIDFNDLNDAKGEYIEPRKLCEYLEEKGFHNAYFRLNRENTTKVKGRSQLRAVLPHELGEVTLDLKRIQFKSGAF